jgi:hypothetical protein
MTRICIGITAFMREDAQKAAGTPGKPTSEHLCIYKVESQSYWLNKKITDGFFEQY